MEPPSENFLLTAVRICLDGRSSLDLIIRCGRRAAYPLNVVLPAGPEEALAVARRRFPHMLKDICDYGSRREYSFSGLSRGFPEEESGRKVRVRADDPDDPSPAPTALEHASCRLSLGECLMHVSLGLKEGRLDEWMLRWLCVEMGYNLDWLFFGLGPMLARWGEAMEKGKTSSVPAPGTSWDPKSGAVTFEDMTSLRDRQTMSLWNYTDWQWLLNLRAMVKATYKAPTIPLLSRLVSGWQLPSQLPQMPDILAWLDWLKEWCRREFTEDGKDRGWKGEVVRQIAASANNGLLLLGLSSQTGTLYRIDRTEPSACVLRLAWLLRMIVDRQGRRGFLNYLDLVNDEAEARGFSNLGEVFSERSWSVADRIPPPGARIEPAEVLAGRSAPWGVPAEALLRPLELLGRVADGSLPSDPDPFAQRGAGRGRQRRSSRPPRGVSISDEEIVISMNGEENADDN